MTTLKTTLKAIIGWLAASSALHAAPVDEARVSMALPAPWTSAHVKAASISADREHICIAGNNNGMGEQSVGYLILLDHAQRAVAWKAQLPVPHHFASVDPFQCLIDSDRVFLLAHVTTTLSSQNSQNLTYLAQFDMHGKRLAATLLDLPNQNIVAYGMTKSGGVLKVIGYTMDATTSGTENYATFTISFDDKLRQHNVPLIRKNGAYVYPAVARIIGDSAYVAGRFFKASVSATQDAGDFSASQLRVDGGYRWSVGTLAGDPRGIATGVAENGTVFTIARDEDKTLLAAVGPDGKAAKPLSYTSRYCDTHQITGYADGALAIREPCRGADPELVIIDSETGAERAVKSIRGTPLFVTSEGQLVIVISRDEVGNTYLKTASVGEL